MALGLLVKNHQHVVMEFATETFDNDAESWRRLLQLMLMVAKEIRVAKEEMVTGETRNKKVESKEGRIVMQTLKGNL